MKQNTKDKVLKTPVIGHLAAFALLPRRLRELKQWEAEVTRLRDIDIRDLAERVEHCVRTEEQILRTEEQIAVAGDERWQATTETCHSLGKQMSDLREMADAERMAREESIRRTREDLDFSRGLNALMADGERLSALRTNLSIHPALWGPAERLHISPEASIGSCYLNTNSGEITVGEFSYSVTLIITSVYESIGASSGVCGRQTRLHIRSDILETDGISSSITSTNRSCGRITAIISPNGVEYSIRIICPKGAAWLDFVAILVRPAGKGVA